jgi:hypothetical protein
MYTSIWGIGVRFTYQYGINEETTNKPSMGGRGSVAPNLLDLARPDKIHRVKKNYLRAEACVFPSLNVFIGLKSYIN